MSTPAFSISARNLKKSFKAIEALKGVSLKFETGVMHGVIGPEGAGKTTMMRLLLGLLRSDAGQVEYRIDGLSVSFDEMKPNIAYMPQKQSLYSELSVDEHLQFFRELYGMSKPQYLEKREELLRITRLSKFTDRPAGKLSGGMYKKLGLMCALLRSPRVILLDEPTNGVDPISRREFWELLYRLSDSQILIILTTSYMDEAERCGHVHLMEEGKVIAEGEPRKLLDEAKVQSFDQFFLARGENAKN